MPALIVKNLWLAAEAGAVGGGGGSGVAMEELAEEGDVGVADGIGNFLHSAVIVFEKTFGGGDAEFL